VEQYQEALHIGLGLKEGGEQPAGGYWLPRKEENCFLIFKNTEKK